MNRQSAVLLWSVWLGLVLLLSSSCASAPPTKGTSREPISAVVAIVHRTEGKRLLGTGTILRSDAAGTYVLTAGHCVAGRGTTRVVVPASLHLDGAGDAGTAYDAALLVRQYDLEVGLDVMGAGQDGSLGTHDYAVLQIEPAGRLRATALGGLIERSQKQGNAKGLAETLWFDQGQARLLPMMLALQPIGGPNPFILGVPLDADVVIRNGMSGSPVIVDGRMIAMVVALSDAEARVTEGDASRSSQVAILIGAPALVRFLKGAGLSALVSRRRRAAPSGHGQGLRPCRALAFAR